MDDLKLNRTVTEPRSPGAGGRFFLFALVIAALLHLLVFGALALSSHNRQLAAQPPAPPTSQSAPAPSAPAVSVSPAATPEIAPMPAAAIPKALPLPRPQPSRRARPIRPTHALDQATTARHAHPLAPTKTPPAHKTHAKPAKVKSAKAAPRRPPAHTKTKPAPALDLDALSKSKSSGR